MKRINICAATLVLGALAMAAFPAQAAVKVGDRVPAIELPASDGKSYNLADFTGKTAMVIAWYPKAFTGG